MQQPPIIGKQPPAQAVAQQKPAVLPPGAKLFVTPKAAGSKPSGEAEAAAYAAQVERSKEK